MLSLPRFRYAWERVQYTLTEARLRIGYPLGFGIRHLTGPQQISLAPTDLIVLCLVRNGAPWLPTFFRHYAELGAKHIILLDNGSTDDTPALAADYPGVSIFATDLPYARYQVAFKRWLVKQFAGRGWALCCDIDELFEYPHRDVLPLSRFLRYLNLNGYTAVVAHLLDMFSTEPLAKVQGRVEDDLTCSYRYYDIADVTKRENPYWLRTNSTDSDAIALYKGGVRARVFGTTWATLTKHPLVRIDGNVRPFASGAHFAAGAHLADVTAVLRHYKFIGSFEEHTRRGIREGQYYRNSRTYRRYQEVYIQQPDLQMAGPATKEYRSAEDLLDSGFLVASDRYLQWVRNQRDAPDV